MSGSEPSTLLHTQHTATEFVQHHDHPYSDTDADIILRTSDNVLFRLYKVMLAKASPIFRDIFSLPTPPSAVDDEHIDGLPVVIISENSTTLKNLLLFIYPGPRPALSADAMITLADAARKYEMFYVVDSMKDAIAKTASTAPLRTFCIAYNLAFYDIARAAAKHSISTKLWLFPPDIPRELRFLPSAGLYRLLQYYDRCMKAAVAVATDIVGVMAAIGVPPAPLHSKGWIWAICTSCTESADSPIQKKRKSSESGQTIVAWWWMDHMDRAAVVLASNPSGSAIQTTEFMSPVLLAANGCITCRRFAYDQLAEFSRRLGKMVDVAVSKVEIDLTD